MYNRYFTLKQLEDKLSDYGIDDDFKSIESSLNIFSLGFFTRNDRKKYDGVSFFDFDDEKLINLEDTGLDNNFDMNKRYPVSEEFKKYLNHGTYYKYLNDLIEYSLGKYEDTYNDRDSSVNLVLYEKYSRRDVCRLLNWPHDDSSTIYGYRIKYNTCPIFVTYEKKEDISSTTKYTDEFENKNIFSWMTRSRVSLDSKEARSIIENRNLKIYLFIKKHDSEGIGFYYIGKVKPVKWIETTITDDKGKKLPIVNFKYKLDNPIKEELYEYLLTEISDD